MAVPTKNRGSDLSSDLNKESRNLEFGERLKERRQKYGFSQLELAQKIGANKNTIQRYESGELPKGNFIIAIAEVLECSIDWLLRGVEFKPDPKTDELSSKLTLDTDLLLSIIQSLENGLHRRGLVLDPDKKAEVIALLYESYSDTEKEVTEQTVERYLKLVA